MTDNSAPACQDELSFMWLEITGRCQLQCKHCYADSGPHGTHGVMTLADWQRVIREAAEVGVSRVQFIGGEPTLHAGLATLVQQAVALQIGVEVFSNLVSIPDRLWSVFELSGVSLATSYYSPEPTEHDAITMRRSHDRTLFNIAQAVGRGIPIRVGVIDVQDGQQTERAVAQLRVLGIDDVAVDGVRAVGRADRGGESAIDELCGRCAGGVLAVSPDGQVWPCVFCRWLSVGSIREMSLRDINRCAVPTRRQLAAAFVGRTVTGCVPDDGGCTPAPCKPIII